MKRIVFLTLFCILTAGAAGATSLEIGLNDFSVQGQYAQTITEDDYGTAQFGARLLYNDNKETTLGSAGFDFLGKPGNVPGLNVGAGALLYAGRNEDGPRDNDLVVVAIGARADYHPPMLNGVGFGGKFNFGPSILSFADAERLYEWALRLDYSVTPKIRIFAEYQEIRTQFETGGTRYLDEGLRAGFEARF
ncbi:MAG: hypothetical protein A2091_09080 [Desulfuromonadales bacterium GWD2_61_12]|nr:MAG: hypothetical protein A2005_01220 [Desulfuromonadales bacterium GWC2_61_20]OGR33665.1 MAG: hypothetical protein A2091_09080 [Desulfuromonadales bacterium GWD2_61_12]HAD03915.1 hypothetical protein [Desulfuromonas sp.]HBT83077.1 hypothetical protein [Desulfuromonas sp.]